MIASASFSLFLWRSEVGNKVMCKMKSWVGEDVVDLRSWKVMEGHGRLWKVVNLRSCNWDCCGGGVKEPQKYSVPSQNAHSDPRSFRQVPKWFSQWSEYGDAIFYPFWSISSRVWHLNSLRYKGRYTKTSYNRLTHLRFVISSISPNELLIWRGQGVEGYKSSVEVDVTGVGDDYAIPC